MKDKYIEAIVLDKAKQLYNNTTDNDPIVHCNRFPTWEELDATSKKKWKIKAKENLGFRSDNSLSKTIYGITKILSDMGWENVHYQSPIVAAVLSRITRETGVWEKEINDKADEYLGLRK